MLKLTPSTPEHLSTIQAWIQSDLFHRDDPRCTAEGLLTGQGALTFCLADDEGPLCFVRLDAEGDLLRLSTQFGPEDKVSKRRLVTGLLSTGIPAIIEFGKQNGYKGIVYESISESLINFMAKQGFKPVSEIDYALTFEETNV